MLCLRCKNENFSIKNIEVEQEYKGEKFKVPLDVTSCNNCSFYYFTDDQADMLRKKISDQIEASTPL